MHADVRVIRLSRWCRKQNQRGLQSRVNMCPADELLADATFLVVLVDGEIGQIGAVAEVRNCTRNSDEFSRLGPSGDDQIRTAQHRFQT